MKIGDRVRIKIGLVDKYGILNLEEYEGKEATVMCVYSDGDVKLDIDKYNFFWKEDMLEPINEWKQGDILEDEDGDEYKILEVLGNIVFLSGFNDFGSCDEHNLISYFKEQGYHLKGESKKEELKKTIKELEEKVKQLKEEVKTL